MDEINRDIEVAKRVVVQDHTLEHWAKTNPNKLEKMFEVEFDEQLREHMVLVYRHFCMGGVDD